LYDILFSERHSHNDDPDEENSMLQIIKNLLGGSNEAQLRKLKKQLEAVNRWEPDMEALNDSDLRTKTEQFKKRFSDGETLDDLLPEAFAAVREAARRTVGMRPYDVQILGGIVLHQGRIPEMKTGEGKTLVSTLPAYLNALAGKGVHIVTVNDYLARRDSEWMGKVHRFMGLTVGLIVHGLDSKQRRAAYAADITYGTNNELGFDYLRDNMVIYKEDIVQRGHAYAIVDEVDSILVDEARTPLIISGQGDKPTDMYEKADAFVSRLRRDADYELDEKEKSVILTEQGTIKAENAFGIENISDIEHIELYHHLLQALKARAMMKRDVDYVVQNGEVIIVDEFTGRLMLGRRYSDGLHQAIEAKEHVEVARESRTLATVTFQNYFRMYEKLAGMTGTAKTEEDEFQGIYGLDVVEVPTNKPMIRTDLNDVVYKNKRAKFNASLNEIVRRHETGQPLLVGTVSVEISEMLSGMLTKRGIAHEVLNAKNHQKEAEIVAQAGHYGAVTIATNMAGRGTDILLGGNPEFLARRAMRQEEYEDEMIEEAVGHNENVSAEALAARSRYIALFENHKAVTDKEHDRVVATGGLHIIGTERHESRRIDNQLRGRAGRQGDPGSTQFFISLEDDVMRLFGSDRIAPIVERLGLGDDDPLEAGLLTKQIESAQKRIESRNFDMRKHVLQYDDVMNQQREIMYGQRRQILMGEDMRGYILQMIRELISDTLEKQPGEDMNCANLSDLAEQLERICLKKGTISQHEKRILDMEKDECAALLFDQAEGFYKEREALLRDIGVDMREFERVVLLGEIDKRWMDHIDAMDQLRDGIGLRAYAQHNPVMEYRIESFDMFDEMTRQIREDTLLKLYQAVLQRAPERRAVARPEDLREGGGDPAAKKPRTVKASEKVGRNSPCPCGSGKKYKHCCGA
jgi:preprotein translocase subunit SecA